jgi:trimethylamine--corrinoid protein Co-methyltransferase
MKVRKGLPGGQYKPLTEEDVRKIHDTVLTVLEDVGIEVRLAEARDLFRHAGATVDEERCIVKIPPGLAQDLISKAPDVVTLCGREENGSLDCVIGGKNVYMGTGGTALNVQDPGSDGSRKATLNDIKDMARLVDFLVNIHFYMLNVYPNELPGDVVDVNRFGTALNYTKKHIMGGVYTVEGVKNVIKMSEHIAGSPEKLRERPFISMVTCVVSPLRLDEHYSRLTIEAARNRIPVVVPAEPLCGATSPVTIAGNLVVLTVDTLAGVMLAQLTNPGTPTIFGSVASVADLRTLKYLSGAVEMGLINAGAAQMAQFYRLPYYATAGMSDAKVNDAQAGYESAITNLMVALAGGNFIHDAAGFLEFCLTASYDKLVIDNEIIGMVMRAVEGITVNDDTIAYELIKKAGPGGHYVSSRHTRHHMRTEQYLCELSDKDDRPQWEAAGGKDTKARAAETSRAILDSEPVSFIPEKLRNTLRNEISGLLLE